jgi:ribosomal protein S18 acetylase RimI-like enzyme
MTEASETQTAAPATNARIRPLDELDIDAIVAIDERISGRYRPEVWERRIGYYLRRDPEASVVAESGGKVVGFMLGEVRSGEFGLEEPTGWIEVLGVDPGARGQAIGRRMAEAMLAHFKSQGATSVRTLVDEEMAEIAGFFTSLGFAPSSLRPFARPL